MTVAGAEWCHFDRWFALVAEADFDGDLERLEAELVGGLRSSLNGRSDAESKLSHLTDLRHRLAAADIGVGDLVAAEPPDKAVLAQARRKVGDQALEGRAMTPAMVDTPRARLQRRARYGHWDRFPADPTPWHRRLAGRRKTTFATKGRSFDRYADAAGRLGSDHWMPVVALAESAVRARRPHLAVEVFRAADRPGWHQEFLRRRCLELTGVTLDAPSRSLRAVR